MNAITAFTIDNNVPIPSDIGRSGRARKYPFPDMQVGDSFFAPGMKSTALLTAARHHRKDGAKFTARTVEGGARIWRYA